MKKYIVCENRTELKSSKPIRIYNKQDFIERIKAANENRDCTPMVEHEFETEEEARAKFEELKPALGVQYGKWALYTLDIDELYIEEYEVDEDGEMEYLDELDHEYGEPKYEDDEDEEDN